MPRAGRARAPGSVTELNNAVAASEEPRGFSNLACDRPDPIDS